MTVGTDTPRVTLSYAGPGDYDFAFPVLQESYIDVSHRDTDGSVTALTISVDYTVALNADTSGTVTFTWDEPSGGPYTGDIILERNIPVEQQVDWVNGGPLDMEQLENAFDRITMIAQQLKNLIDVGTSAYNWRGAWSTSTFYNTNELVKESKNIYIVTEDHTSGVFATDLAAGRLELLIDISDIVDAVGILDEDDFASNSATKAPSQQSAAVYIANEIADALVTDINMAGAILRGNCLSKVALSANTDLNNGTHRGAGLVFSTASILSIKPNATTPYSAGFQCVVFATHASGCTVTADSGVDLNGVDGGSVTINQYEAYSLFLDGTDAWIMPNASAS